MTTHPHHYIGFVLAVGCAVQIVRSLLAIHRITTVEAEPATEAARVGEKKAEDTRNDAAVLKEVGLIVLSVLAIIWCFDDVMHLGGLIPG